MSWNPETRQVPTDKFIVDAGTFDSEAEALQNVGSNERPRFKRVNATVHVFVCSECGREHVADIDEHGATIEPEPCDHQHSERDKGPKQPWE